MENCTRLDRPFPTHSHNRAAPTSRENPYPGRLPTVWVRLSRRTRTFARAVGRPADRVALIGGVPAKVPDAAESLLRDEYGADWRTPKRR